MKNTILIIDDEEGIRTSLAGVLEDEGYDVVLAEDGLVGLEQVRNEQPDLVLLDIWMPNLNGMDTLKKFKESWPYLPVIMMSGHGTIETAVKATRMGAYDFIEKPLSLEKVIVTVENALAMSRLREENRSLRSVMAREQELVGETAVLKSLRGEILQAAASDVTVLVCGESGTGKRLVARNIHLSGKRRGQPLVELNCAGLPEELLEGELFGHEKGATSGNGARKKGRLDDADGGTLILAWVDRLPLALQGRLLRFLREGTFQRQGGGQPVAVDVRIIPTTTVSLADEVRQGRFLEDLLFELNVISLSVPPLRDRREDIPLLATQFLSLYSRREGKAGKQISPEALELLAGFSWPGNVRELKNVAERLVIMSPGMTIGDGSLPNFLRGGTSAPPDLVPEAVLTFKEAREQFEREYIAKILAGCEWDVSRAAQILDIERSILFGMVKGYGIEAPREGL